MKQLVVVTILMLSACDGGGGSGSPPTSSSQGGGPTNAPPTGPAAGPGITLTGSVVAKENESAIAGATVVMSHTVIVGATPPAAAPSDGAIATTTSVGSYSLALLAQGSYPSRFYLEVFSPGKPTEHAILTVAGAGANAAPMVGLTSLSSDEAAWLALVNADRAKWSAPPLVFDETAEEVARLWAAFLATGHYEHTCAPSDVGCPDKAAYEAAAHADYPSLGENIGANAPPGSYADTEAQFMSESANCPQPVNVATCPYTETTGHFLNIVNTTATWVGLAEALNGKSYDPTTYGPTLNYFDMEFGYATFGVNLQSLKTRSALSIPK